MLALGLVAFTPTADAGQYARVYTKHGPTYVHKSALYGSNHYYDSDYRHGSRYRRSHRGDRYRYYEPVRYSRRSYRSYDRGYRSYDDGYYRTSSRRYYSSRPRFAISFGF